MAIKVAGTTIVDDSGNITATVGTIDGRDIAGDGTKLDTVEQSADVTDVTNVTAAGALMKTGGTMTGSLVLDANPSTNLGAATKQYVDTEVAGIVDSAPATLDTLNELAAALGDDADFATTTSNSIGTKLPKSGGTMTGSITFASGQTFDGRDVSADGTKLDGIASGATNVTNTNQLTNGAGFITSANGGNAATLDNIDSASFLRSDATDTFTNLSGTSVTLGSGVTLKESSDRADLLEIKSTTSGWGGLQITNTPEEGRWSFMTDGTGAGLYDDQNAHWHLFMVENSYTNLYHDNNERLRTLSGGVGTTGLTVGDVDANPHNTGGLQVSNTNDEKIVLSGSNDPYIRWQEGTTDKFYIQWNSGGYPIFGNQETGQFHFRANSNDAAQLKLRASDGDVYGSFYGDHSDNIGILDGDNHWAYKHAKDSSHEWRINNTAYMSLSTSTLDMKGITITEVEDIGLRDRLYHDGDTDTYLEFDTNQINMVTAGSTEVTINSTGVRLGDTGNGYFQPVSGNYGSIQIDGGAHSSYEGYSIGGRAVFMHDNSTTTGIFNDVNNHWLFLGIHNGESRMYHAGAQKIYTYNGGGRVTGSLLASSNVYAYYSDERLKAKDGVIEDALGKINSLETFYYHENDLAKEHGHDNDKRQLGVSAQQVEAILPECVAPAPFDLETDNEGNEWSKSGEDYLTVDYPRLVPLLIKGIQEQQAQIEDLKKEVQELKHAHNK